MSIRVVISDLTPTGHPETVRSAILAGYGEGLTEEEIEIRCSGFAADLEYAQSIGALAVVRSTVGVSAAASIAFAKYPSIQCFMPLGSNNHVEITTVTEIPNIVTCGASDTAHNETGFGNGLEFFDDDNDALPTDYSSYSNGIIAGKILKIKDERACNWWEARYCARATASYAAEWTKEDGFGKIDVAAATAYSGTVPDDPFHVPGVPVALPAGNISDHSFTASWEAASGATGYSIDVSSQDNFESFVVGLNGYSVGNVLSCALSGLPDGVTYYYRVRGTNVNGSSSSSNTISVSLPLSTEEEISSERRVMANRSNVKVGNAVAVVIQNLSADPFVIFSFDINQWKEGTLKDNAEPLSINVGSGMPVQTGVNYSGEVELVEAARARLLELEALLSTNDQYDVCIVCQDGNDTRIHKAATVTIEHKAPYQQKAPETLVLKWSGTAGLLTTALTNLAGTFFEVPVTIDEYDVVGACFDRAEMSSAVFVDESKSFTAIGSSFRHTRLYGATLSTEHQHSTFEHCSFSGASMDELVANNCAFTDCLFDWATLPTIIFTACDITRSLFSNAYLEDATITDGDASDCIFSDANLNNAHFTVMTAPRAIFDRAIVTGCDFTSTVLAGGSFQDCDCTGAIFTGANIAGVNFRNAILTSATLPTNADTKEEFKALVADWTGVIWTDGNPI